jgi:hypothetical protein
MKRFLLFLLITATGFNAVAQDDETIVLSDKVKKSEPLFRSNVLAFYPGFWAPGFKVESANGKQNLSYGAHVRGYVFLFNGGKVEPFIRVYFKKKAPEGLFMQFKIHAAIYNANSVFFRGLKCYTGLNGQYICPGDPGYVQVNEWRYFFGGGVAAGYQFLLGEKKRFALDLFGGIQVIIPKDRLLYDEDIYLWLTRGFPAELGIRLGWAF